MKLGRIQTLDWLNAYIDRLENKLRGLHEPCPGCGSLTWNAMNAKKRICDDCNPEAIMEGFPICSKCGGTDIYTRWRQKGQRLSDIWWHDENREYAADECLFRVCRACGCRWTDKIWAEEGERVAFDDSRAATYDELADAAPRSYGRSAQHTQKTLARLRKALDMGNGGSLADIADRVEWLVEKYSRICARLQECAQRHKLGLGGEELDRVVVEEVDRLRSIVAGETKP